MPSFKGQRVFRNQGYSGRQPDTEWSKTASKAISQGAKVFQDDSGAQHLVSPSGAHWGTYKRREGLYEGGTLSKFSPDDSAQDITYAYNQNGQ